MSYSYCNFQICVVMTGLAAIVVVGAYMGKEIKSLVICLFILELFKVLTMKLFMTKIGRDHMLEVSGGKICSKNKN